MHAVTAIAGLVHTAFAYDANGNQVSGNGRSITWSSYNKPLEVHSGGATVSMAYGPERQLIRQSRPDGQGGTETVYYASPLFEQTVTQGGATRSRYHITAAGQTVAVINETATGAPETHYLHRDHLDSIVALSNERGQVLERFHYDPFGQRLSSDTQIYALRRHPVLRSCRIHGSSFYTVNVSESRPVRCP